MTPHDLTPKQHRSDTEISQHRALTALYIVLAALALWVVREFIPAVVWAGVIAIALAPVRRRLETSRWLHGRGTLSAVLLTLAVALLFVLPLALTAAQAIHEAHELNDWWRQVQEHGIPMPDALTHLPYGIKPLTDWWQTNLAAPLNASPAGKALHGHSIFAVTRAFGLRTAHGAMLFSFMLLTLFFILRAGPSLSDRLLHGAQRAFGIGGAELATRMSASVRGTVIGLVVVGLGEGALLGIAYMATGLPHAALLGMLTAIAAMVPFCAPIPFAGAALWLFIQGSTATAIGLLVFGFVVVFIAEHFIRPVLIGGAARLPFLLVLFGILGGAGTFGLLGLFVGPAIMTVLMLLWSEWTA